MVDTSALKGSIVAHGYTQRSFAAKIGMSEHTFYDKMKRRVFNSDEILSIIEALEIDDPTAIFFVKEVACRAT